MNEKHKEVIKNISGKKVLLYFILESNLVFSLA